MDALEAIMTRRSTRKFKPDLPEKECIEKVVEAGRYAPSGGNNQSSHIFVITDPDILKNMAAVVQSLFEKMELKEGMYPSLASSIKQSKNGNYVFHYHAPVLIVTANDKDYGNNMADCACVLENMMIAANALDLGSCWINQLKWLNEKEEILDMFRAYGLKDNERIYGALALGYADTEDAMPARVPLARKGNEVVFVEKA